MRSRGFTLVELAISLLLASGVLASVVWNFAGAARRHAEVDALVRLQERATLALGALEIEVQMAGFGGLQPLAALQVPGVSRAQDPCGWFATSPPEPVRVTATPGPAGCDAQSGGQVPGTDVLRLVRAAARTEPAEAGRWTLMTSIADAALPALLDGGTVHTALLPGRLEARAVVATLFYVARRSDGDAAVPSLRSKELTSIAGRPAVRDTEVVDGVEGLRVETAWIDADALRFDDDDARPRGQPVRAVRLTLSLRSPKGQRLVQSRTIALRNVPEAES